MENWKDAEADVFVEQGPMRVTFATLKASCWER